MTPAVVLETPWPPAAIPPPKISESAGAELTQFEAHRKDGAASTGPAITFGCVATPIPGWVEDMRPAVEGRTVALAGASAALAADHPIDARPDGRGGFELRDVRHLEDPPVGHARTFIGFDAKRVHTCFATCVGAPCEGAVDAARLTGSAPPPSAGIALGAVDWAVHHPRPFATGAACAVVLAGFLAVALRKRPRFSGF